MAQQSMHDTGMERSHPPAGTTSQIDSSEALTEIWVPAKASLGKDRNRPATVKWFIAGILMLIILAGLIGIVFFGQLLYASALILPGVQVMGIDVGSMTKVEAGALLAQEWEQRSMVVTYEETVWPVGVTDLGFVLNAQAMVDEGYAQGRSLDSLLQLLEGKGQIEAQWTFDSSRAANFLQQFADQVNTPAVDAGLRIVEGQVVETAPQNGRILDLQMTIAQLQENPEKFLQEGRLPLVMNTLPPQIRDVSHLAQEARLLLTNQITVKAYDPIQNETFEQVIEPQAWHDWMTLQVSSDGTDQFDWQVDDQAVMAYFNEQFANLEDGRYFNGEELLPQLVEAISNRQPQIAARIYHKPRLHIVQSGETLSSIGRDYGIPYPWIQDANPNADFLRAGDEIVIPSPDEMVPLPVVQNKRVVVSISQQKTWVYEDGQVKWEWPSSTGIDSSPTSPGVFQVQTHESNAYASNWDLWMPNFMGIYRPIPTSDFMNGFHGFPTRNGSTLLWTGDLGHQVTYGCILLSSENAAQLYDWAENGVIVEVTP